MAKLLIIIHGMGVYEKGWSQEIMDTLDATASAYPGLKGSAKPFSSTVQTAEVLYDPVLAKYVDKVQRDADELRAFAKDTGLSLSGALQQVSSGQLPQAATDFFWTTLIDPIFYRGIPLVRDDVRVSVRAQIARIVTDYLAKLPGGEQPSVSVLCHSLGTAVTHDALHQLASKPETGFAALTSDRFTFDSVFALADVSQLGPPALIDIDSYASAVRPVLGAPPPPAGVKAYLQRCYNFRHAFDPFCVWPSQRFAPQWDAPGYPSPPDVRHVHQLNVHGFTHYLKHPSVHVPILRRLLGPSAISPADLAAALTAFPAVEPPACNALVKSLAAALKKLHEPSSNPLEFFDELFDAGRDMLAAFQKAKTACPQISSGMAGI